MSDTTPGFFMPKKKNEEQLPFFPRRLLAVDPGESCGVAFFVDGIVTEIRKIHGDDILEIEEIIEHYGPDRIIVEEPVFFSAGLSKGLSTLIRREVTWEVLGELHGVHVVKVKPSTWMSYCKIKRGDRSMSRYEKKKAHDAALVVLANRMLGDQTIVVDIPDQAAAYLIGEYHLSQFSQAERASLSVHPVGSKA